MGLKGVAAYKEGGFWQIRWQGGMSANLNAGVEKRTAGYRGLRMKGGAG